jgi:ABC-type phosphate transport system substrate-binding protein
MKNVEPMKNRPSSGARAVVAIVLLGLLGAAAPGSAEGKFRVIVNAELSGVAIQKNRLSALFLNGTGRWGTTGRQVVLVDQSLASPVRAAFSREVLQMDPRSVLTYWNRRLVEGKGRPPKVKASDAEVVAFVASKAGGIGYVSAAIELPPGVRVLEIVD